VLEENKTDGKCALNLEVGIYRLIGPTISNILLSLLAFICTRILKSFLRPKKFALGTLGMMRRYRFCKQPNSLLTQWPGIIHSAQPKSRRLSLVIFCHTYSLSQNLYHLKLSWKEKMKVFEVVGEAVGGCSHIPLSNVTF
jgi:hypothetical protein